MFNHDLKNIRVALFFKDFAAWIRSSCVGLNVAGFTTAKVLNKNGIETVVYPVRHNIDVVNSIDKYNETHKKGLTHVIISAPWLSLHDVKNLIKHFPHIQFVILSHSNVGFLQADPGGVELLRKYGELSKIYNNLKVGGNSPQFAHWFRLAYQEQCICLPNLYPHNHIKHKVWDGKSPLKIGAFGAIRPEKNFMTAAAAALAIHSILEVPIEFHMSTGGGGCKSMTLPAISEMLNNIDGVSLIRHEWETWDKFIHLIKDMDLLIQVSYTESFNMITADGVSVGVPTVASPAITWVPESWKANPDNALDAARVGVELLLENQHYLGSEALNKHNEKSIRYWKDFLTGNC